MKNSDKPAYPFIDPEFTAEGLTKREYFAAMAMQGMVSNDFRGTTSQFAKIAIELADELLKQLEK